MRTLKQKQSLTKYEKLINSNYGTPNRDSITAIDLNLISYSKAYDLQISIFEKVKLNDTPGVLLLLEHPPVITIGSNRNIGNLLATEEELARRDIELVQSNRGGDITLHSPEQLVCYIILNLNLPGRDLSAFVYKIEKIIIDTLKHFGIESSRVEKHRGVFVGNTKIASIGLKVRKWVTLHGFSLNVNNDLNYFDNIIPCGLKDYPQTSIEKILKKPLPMSIVKEQVVKSFEDVFKIPVKKSGNF
jgi:lipoyl(octanoyl) transferase